MGFLFSKVLEIQIKSDKNDYQKIFFPISFVSPLWGRESYDLTLTFRYLILHIDIICDDQKGHQNPAVVCYSKIWRERSQEVVLSSRRAFKLHWRKWREIKCKLSSERRNRNKEGTRQGVPAPDWTKRIRLCLLPSFIWFVCWKKVWWIQREKREELSGALFNDKTSFCWNIH